MADVVETTFDIRVKNIFAPLVDVTKDCCNCIMSTASRSEPIAVGLKQGFPLGFQSLFGYCLTCSLEHHRHHHSTLPPLTSHLWNRSRSPIHIILCMVSACSSFACAEGQILIS